jgi:methyl-accepting chemotaxis protein
MKIAGIFLNLSIRSKIISGFIIMLLLLILVAYIGYNGILKVRYRYERSNDVYLLVRNIMEIRQLEKSFIMSGDESYISRVDEGLQKILDQAETTQGKFKLLNNRNQMDTVIQAAINFKEAFHSYVELERQQNIKMEDMGIQSQTALKKTQECYNQQLSQLTADLRAGSGIARIQESVANAIDADQIIKWFLEARKNEKDYIISGNQAFYDTHDELLNKTIEMSKELKEQLTNDVHLAMADEVINNFNLYQKNWHEFVTLMDRQVQAENRMVALAVNADKKCEVTHAYQQEQLLKQISMSNSLLLIIALLTIILGLVIAIVITNSISKPIVSVSEAAVRIGEGDIAVELPSSPRMDEVGVLMRAFSRMILFLKEMTDTANLMSKGNLQIEIRPQSEKDIFGNAFRTMSETLKSQLKEISDSTTILTSMVTDISATSSQLSASSTETVTAISETTTTVEEVKQTAMLTNEKAKSISENSAKTVQVARNGEKAVNETSNGMTRIREQMGSIAESIMKLSEQSQAIGNIMNSINDLAEQSNLLAVNASIEAAKAGEEGKGFAVVAEEVKSLAQQSKLATQQVREILTDVQKATSTAVMATEEGSKVVEAGIKQAADAGNAIKALADVINEAAQSTSQIGASVQQQFVGINQVTEAIRNISVASNQNLESTKQLEKTSEKLDVLAKNLINLVEQYQI